MESKLKVIAVIPARGGSKSLPKKNIRPIAGRPLLYWSLDALTEAEVIDEVWVSTDDDVITETVRCYNDDESPGVPVQVFHRSPETATDTASSESALLEFAGQHNFEIFVFVQATSPLLDADSVSRAVEMVRNNTCDSVLSVVRQKRFIWKEKDGAAVPVNYDPLNRPRRQEFDGFLVENGAVYVTTKKALMESKTRISGRIGTIEMDEATYYEIDEPDDWIVVERLLERRQKDRKSRTGKRDTKPPIRLLIVDCDGTLTDSGMYYSPEGEALKKFNTRDAAGLRMAREAGITVAIMSGEDSAILAARARKIGVSNLFLGVSDKLKETEAFAKREVVSLDEIAFVGDDLNDLSVMKAVGYSACPADAVEAVREIADYVSPLTGGHGTVRDIVEMILQQL